MTSLLPLLPGTSMAAASELLELVVACPDILTSGGVAKLMNSAQLVLGHFYEQLCRLSQQMTEGKGREGETFFCESHQVLHRTRGGLALGTTVDQLPKDSYPLVTSQPASEDLCLH